MRGILPILALIGFGLSGCQGARSERSWTLLVEFATSLEGRTQGQRHNATLVARRLNGAILAPNAEWSFNAAVGQWVRSEGYVRAPVSYGGILVPSWGGGVCQTSTTLYNAALLAGLEVTERHAHTIAPSYIGAGRDAAVAQGIADLKIRNPYPFPCRVEFIVNDSRLVCKIFAQASTNQARRHVPECVLHTEVNAIAPAPAVVGFRAQAGRAGAQVRLWRVCTRNGETWRELCHETQYAPLPRGISTGR
ncbi:MAG: VanW family protein [Fimbriimonadales bacterium]